MSLPVNIENLLSGTIVEGERMEFKEGWNPGPIMRTVCAFANDFENLGSGYIIVGVEEQDGKPVRPVKGFPPADFEKVQQEMQNYANLMRPVYFPRLYLEAIDGRHVLVIWVPAGSHRPYKVPREVKARQKDFQYYIRQYSSTIIPSTEQEVELVQLTSHIPFDDRVNTRAQVSELSVSLMQEHLQKTRSKLYEESRNMDAAALARQMNLAEGADEHLFSKNIGLLMFSEDPQRYFRGAQVDVVEFPEGMGATEFGEKSFHGPVQKQLINALDYLQNRVIREKVIKRAGKAEADRVFNYPYEALEEALSNAVYHRNYEMYEPIEVQVLPESIKITSFGGADPSIRATDLERGMVRVRRYRNRRVGEFLKELRLTEGRGTGIPTIKRVLAANGSAEPKFDMGEPARDFFIIEIPVHPAFLKPNDQVSAQVSAQVLDKIKGLFNQPPDFSIEDLKKYQSLIPQISNEQYQVLYYCQTARKRKEILEEGLSISNHTNNYKRHIEPLLQQDLLSRTIPEKPQSQHQKYFTTEKGRILLYLKEQSENT